MSTITKLTIYCMPLAGILYLILPSVMWPDKCWPPTSFVRP